MLEVFSLSFIHRMAIYKFSKRKSFFEFILPLQIQQSQKKGNQAEYAYTPLKDVKIGMTKVNVYGVVTFCTPPRPTRGTGFLNVTLYHVSNCLHHLSTTASFIF